MPNPWMPGLIHDPGRGAGYAVGTNRMWMGVDHDTGGTNSYEIVKNGRPDAPSTLANILFPKAGIPWQFAEINALCYHAGSSMYGDYNPLGPGFEVERRQGEPLTVDQVYWIGKCNAWCESEWGLPNTHYWGPQFPWRAANFNGWVNHRDIHPNPDGLTHAEWDLITGSATSAPKRRKKTMFVAESPGGLWLVGDTSIQALDAPSATWIAIGLGQPLRSGTKYTIPVTDLFIDERKQLAAKYQTK